jgi:serine/threonine protein kinase
VLVLEHCGAGDLHGILSKHGGRISERMCVRKVLAPLLTALQVCNNQGRRVHASKLWLLPGLHQLLMHLGVTRCHVPLSSFAMHTQALHAAGIVHRDIKPRYAE